MMISTNKELEVSPETIEFLESFTYSLYVDRLPPERSGRIVRYDVRLNRVSLDSCSQVVLSDLRRLIVEGGKVLGFYNVVNFVKVRGYLTLTTFGCFDRTPDRPAQYLIEGFVALEESIAVEDLLTLYYMVDHSEERNQHELKIQIIR